MTLRNRLHRLLFEREVTGKELAHWLEMDPAHLNRIKNGHTSPSVGTALRIASILGLEIEEIFFIETEGRREPARFAGRARGGRGRGSAISEKVGRV